MTEESHFLGFMFPHVTTLLCRRFGYIPFILSPFGIVAVFGVAVLTFAVLVCRRFDQAPQNWKYFRFVVAILKD